jgi:hypothetical protein
MPGVASSSASVLEPWPLLGTRRSRFGDTWRGRPMALDAFRGPGRFSTRSDVIVDLGPGLRLGPVSGSSLGRPGFSYWTLFQRGQGDDEGEGGNGRFSRQWEKGIAVPLMTS